MKLIKLTQGRETIVDDEDYEYLNQWKWHFGSRRYAIRSINCSKKKITMHSLLINCPKHKYIDHINGNPLDNRKINLRLCTTQENQRNRKSNETNKKISKYKGVSKSLNKYWRSYIYLNGKQINIGSFKTEIEAAQAYNKKAIELFGEFARLNVI
jgi:hypothetical protein